MSRACGACEEGVRGFEGVDGGDGRSAGNGVEFVIDGNRLEVVAGAGSIG